jgi:hypothetical protein
MLGSPDVLARVANAQRARAKTKHVHIAGQYCPGCAKIMPTVAVADGDDREGDY